MGAYCCLIRFALYDLTKTLHQLLHLAFGPLEQRSAPGQHTNADANARLKIAPATFHANLVSKL